MRAVFIDPFKQTVSPLFDEFDKQVTDELFCHHLGSNELRYTPLDGVNILIHDEIGLARKEQAYWSLSGQPAIIAGSGLILSKKGDEWASSTAIVGVVQKLIGWRSPADAKLLYHGFDRWEQVPRIAIDRYGVGMTVHG